MHRKKRVVTCLLTLAMIGSILIGHPAQASNYDEQEAAIQQAQDDLLAKQAANRAALAQTQDEIAAFTAQSNSIQAQLDNLLEQNLTSTEEYERLTRELEVAREEMNKSIVRYEEAQQFADDKQVEYETRIVTLFKYRNKSVFELLLSSDSIEGFFSNMRLMDYIASADNKMLEDLIAAQEAAEVARLNAEETVVQARAYFEHAETQLELLRNEIGLTETNLGAVEAELLNRSAVENELEQQHDQMDEELAAYYAQLQAIENARATEAAIAESIRVSESIVESQRVSESIAESELYERRLEESRENERLANESLRAAEAARASAEEAARVSQEAANAWQARQTTTNPPTTAAPAPTQAPATNAPVSTTTTPAATTPITETPVTSSNYLMWPLVSYSYISSHYGPRVHPITGNSGSFHFGTDFAAPFGTPVRATLDGTVVIANATWQGQNYTSHKTGHGNYVTIQHANGLTSTYAHLKYVAVSVGQTVSQGQYIGQVGSTGASTGAHLHFEMAQYGSTFNTYSSNWLLNTNARR